MTKAEFEKLVTEFGELSFQCGDYDQDDRAEFVSYENLQAKCEAAKQAALDAYMEKEQTT